MERFDLIIRKQKVNCSKNNNNNVKTLKLLLKVFFFLQIHKIFAYPLTWSDLLLYGAILEAKKLSKRKFSVATSRFSSSHQIQKTEEKKMNVKKIASE